MPGKGGILYQEMKDWRRKYKLLFSVWGPGFKHLGFREWKRKWKLLYYNRVYWGYIGIMEKKMETTIMDSIGIISLEIT